MFKIGLAYHQTKDIYNKRTFSYRAKLRHLEQSSNPNACMHGNAGHDWKEWAWRHQKERGKVQEDSETKMKDAVRIDVAK